MKLIPSMTLLLMTSLFSPAAEANTVAGEPEENSTALREEQPISASTVLSRYAPRRFGGGQEEPENRFRPRVNLRLGAVVSPEANFAAGLDFPLDGLRLSRDFSGRLDIEFLAVNFKNKRVSLFGSGIGSGTSLYIPVTLNQVYVGGLRRGGKVYGGFGTGVVADVNIFVEPPGAFTGKVFVGAQFNARSSAELGVNFIGKDTLVTLQLRLGL